MNNAIFKILESGLLKQDLIIITKLYGAVDLEYDHSNQLSGIESYISSYNTI